MSSKFVISTSLAACLLTLSVGASVAHAEEVIAGSVYDESKETEIVQKARRRIYPGGRDEGDLAVQSQLIAPTRKVAPQIEGADHSTDD